MANPVGRPKSDIETRMIALRIPVELFNRLTRYVDLTTRHSRGAKASINSVGNYALEYFLNAQESKREPTPQASQQPFTLAHDTAPRPRKFVLASTTRKKILRLLQQRPEGLSPAQTKKLLGEETDLGSTMKGMYRDGLLNRVQPGRYIVAEGVEIP